MGEPLTVALELADEQATADLGSRLAAALPDDPGGLEILLAGELGAGKSTLARALLRALGHQGAVPSPTYTLVEPYKVAGKIIYHIDLYRISSSDELEFLGWSDLDDGLCLIEWPERVPELAERADLLVTLGYVKDGRSAELRPLSQRGFELLAGINLK